MRQDGREEAHLVDPHREPGDGDEATVPRARPQLAVQDGVEQEERAADRDPGRTDRRRRRIGPERLRRAGGAEEHGGAENEQKREAAHAGVLPLLAQITRSSDYTNSDSADI